MLVDPTHACKDHHEEGGHGGGGGGVQETLVRHGFHGMTHEAVIVSFGYLLLWTPDLDHTFSTGILSAAIVFSKTVFHMCCFSYIQ